MSDDSGWNTDFKYRELLLCAKRDGRRLTTVCYALFVATIVGMVALTVEIILIFWQFKAVQPTHWAAIFPTLVLILATLISYFKIVPCQDKVQFCVNELDHIESNSRTAHIELIYKHYQSADCSTLVAKTLKELKPSLPIKNPLGK